MKISIIVPFTGINSNFVRFLKSINDTKPKGKNIQVEYLFILNKKEGSNIIKNTIFNKVKGIDYKIYKYTKSLGPSQTWCFGIKKSNADYVWLVASDCIIAKQYETTIANTIKKNKLPFYIGDYYSSNKKGTFQNIESAIDKDRYKRGKIDFRNFLANREEILKIIKKYFKNKYCSDAELDLLLRAIMPYSNVGKIDLKIYNNYPKRFLIAAKRKFKHGVGFGRIYKKFFLQTKKNNKLKDILWPFFIILDPSKFLVKTKLEKKLKPLLVTLNIVFYFGMLSGYLLPRSFIKKFYIFHFDE